MSQDVYRRLHYLQRISEQLQQSDQTDGPCQSSLSQLISFYGKESKEIQFKNQIKSFGWDVLKLSRCKKCHVLFDFAHTQSKSDQRRLVKVKKGVLRIVCNNCAFERRYPVKKERHTKHEKLIFDKKLANPSLQVKGQQDRKERNEQSKRKQPWVTPRADLQAFD